MNKKYGKNNTKKINTSRFNFGTSNFGRFYKEKFNTTYLVLVIFIVVLLIFNLVLYLKKVAKPNQDNEISMQKSQNIINTENKKKENQTKAIPKTDEEVVKYLSTLKEGNRMEYYCGQFINYIDDEEYEKAYDLLYDEFKQNYFPTYEDFVNYAKNFYPKFFGVEYDDIDRYDDMYVLRLKIVDYKASEKDAEKVQRVVIREYSYNKYSLSFSVEKDLIDEQNEQNTNSEDAQNIEENATVIIN